ncbi:MAG: hypothetical protein HYW10_01105 [Candidatus Omnitrophica bacterium]|nr:hypothetical protein [Candidatus Omnitrophota bacterium]
MSNEVSLLFILLTALLAVAFTIIAFSLKVDRTHTIQTAQLVLWIVIGGFVLSIGFWLFVPESWKQIFFAKSDEIFSGIFWIILLVLWGKWLFWRLFKRQLVTVALNKFTLGLSMFCGGFYLASAWYATPRHQSDVLMAVFWLSYPVVTSLRPSSK